MRTTKNVWFWFKDIYSWETGALMTAWPTREAPALRGKEKEVSGRDGDIYVTDGTYGTIEVTQEFVIRDIEQSSTVNDWLRGSGLLRFSDEPNMAYNARVKNLKSEPMPGRLLGRKYTERFICQPFKYQYPAEPAVTFTASGSINNPGTAYSLPRVTITGTGDFSVTIGEETLYFNDVSGGIVVDSELMDALTLDGTALANQHMSGQPWKIQPGMNSISWEAEAGSTLTSVAILPRWRFL